MPIFILLLCGAAGAVFVYMGKRSGKPVYLVGGVLLCLLGCGWYFYSSSDSFRSKQAKEGAINQFQAEAFAVARAAAETAAGEKILILGVQTPEEMTPFLEILQREGVSDAEYIQVFEGVPMGVPLQSRLKRIRAAMNKVQDAECIVALGPGILLMKETEKFFGEKKKAIQTGAKVDETLWSRGIIAAHVKPRAETSQFDLSSDPEKAALQGYEIRKFQSSSSSSGK